MQRVIPWAVRMQVAAMHTALSKVAFQASHEMLTRAGQSDVQKQERKAKSVKPGL